VTDVKVAGERMSIEMGYAKLLIRTVCGRDQPNPNMYQSACRTTHTTPPTKSRQTSLHTQLLR
jgi:hypothetical protein